MWEQRLDAGSFALHGMECADEVFRGPVRALSTVDKRITSQSSPLSDPGYTWYYKSLTFRVIWQPSLLCKQGLLVWNHMKLKQPQYIWPQCMWSVTVQMCRSEGNCALKEYNQEKMKSTQLHFIFLVCLQWQRSCDLRSSGPQPFYFKAPHHHQQRLKAHITKNN